MKKHLIIATIAIVIIIATVVVSFAAWDLFADKDELTFKTGDSVKLDISKDTTFTTKEVLVPKDAMKPTADYVYEMQIAKDVELKNTTAIADIDSLEFVWDLTKVTVMDKTLTSAEESTFIKDVASFKEEFTLVFRPNSAADDTQDIPYGGKIALSTTTTPVKYNVLIKFNKASNDPAQKRGADNKLVFVDTANNDNEIEYSYAEFMALDASRKGELEAIYAYTLTTNDSTVYYTDTAYNALTAEQKETLIKNDYFNTNSVPEFTLRGIKIEITIEAANKTASKA